MGGGQGSTDQQGAVMSLVGDHSQLAAWMEWKEKEADFELPAVSISVVSQIGKGVDCILSNPNPVFSLLNKFKSMKIYCWIFLICLCLLTKTILH